MRRPGFGHGGAPRGRNGAQALMLALALWQQAERLPYKPPVTIAAIALQALIYVQSPLSPEQACLAPVRALAQGLLSEGTLLRLVASPLHHADDAHIYYNSASFLLKGVTLEARYGSARFAVVLLALTALTQAVYVALCVVLGSQECAVGFSGVIFALKLLCSVDDPGSTVVGGIAVPTKFAAWAELVLIALVAPRTSFLAHLAGILAGLLFVCAERAFARRADASLAAVMHAAFGLFGDVGAWAGWAAGAGAARGGLGGGGGGGGGGWNCARCTMHNEAGVGVCSACGERRRGTYGSGVLGGGGGDGGGGRRAR
jgi:rhomboid domain-containing protein 1